MLLLIIYTFKNNKLESDAVSFLVRVRHYKYIWVCNFIDVRIEFNSYCEPNKGLVVLLMVIML